jgi:putative spermidine/putrescine transport system ATP-binding protein
MSFLKLTNVSKFYGATSAVSSFNLSVEKGEFISLLGPSGCGKTTTLQMIGGFEAVSGGRIELDGRDITHAKPNTRGLGIVFQTYALFPHMTVEQNVAFGLEMRKCPVDERRDRVAQALALVHLEQHGKRYPRELSGGQRQRVALARALVIAPPVLLLDEPLSNLDAQLREEMQFELRDIQRKVGTTTIMVTHDQSEAMSISDRVVVMEAGHVTQVGQPLTVYEHPGNRFISTFVGKANLLEGRVQGKWAQGVKVEVGGVTLLLEAAVDAFGSSSQVLLGLRPEKLHGVARDGGRCNGVVERRFFLGSQWLYEIASVMGALTMLVPNDGAAPLGDGQQIGLDWSDRNLRLISASRAIDAVTAAEAA